MASKHFSTFCVRVSAIALSADAANAPGGRFIRHEPPPLLLNPTVLANSDTGALPSLNVEPAELAAPAVLVEQDAVSDSQRSPVSFDSSSNMFIRHSGVCDNDECDGEHVFDFTPGMLYESLRGYDTDGDDVFTRKELDKAYATTDQWGQKLRSSKLPDRKFLMDSVRHNDNGDVSGDEIRSWRGYRSNYCSNLADVQYGCKKRCTNGQKSSTGIGGYFTDKYSRFMLEEPRHTAWRKLDDKELNFGDVSEAQGALFERALAHIISTGVPGAVTEFGVYTGGTSMELATLLQAAMYPKDESQLRTGPRRELHLYDSFAGLPHCDRDKDFGMCAEGNLRTSAIEFEKEVLPLYKDTYIHKGIFQNLTEKDLPDEIAFAFLDGDLYESIYSSFRLIYPRLSKGAIVFIHDFGWEGYPATETALLDALSGLPERPLLPQFSTTSAGVPPGIQDGFVCYLGMVIKT